MANVRREAAPARRGAGSEWDPFQTMRELVGWDPFPEMFPRGRRGGEDRLPFAPAFDVRETEDAYVFEADVPGFGQEDIDINLTGNRLTVSGRREAEEVDESDTVYCCERSYGSFTRSFTLPADVDPDPSKRSCATASFRCASRRPPRRSRSASRSTAADARRRRAPARPKRGKRRRRDRPLREAPLPRRRPAVGARLACRRATLRLRIDPREVEL